MIHRDASNKILKIQMQIFAAKPMQERWKIACEMIDMGFYIVRQNILSQNPNISEIDLRVAVFRRCYQQDYTPEFMDMIEKGMRDFYEKQSLLNIK